MTLRNKINRLVKKAKKRYLNDKIKQCGNLNSRQRWKEVKSFAGMNNNHQVSSILYNGRLLEGVELANHINNCFVLTTTNISELSVQPTITEVPDRYRVSVDEVELKLSQVKSCKAVGPDDIPNWILRDFSNILSLPLCSIFNASIEEACLPRIWKSADVIPSPKIVPVKDAATDLRPISLTPVMSKIGESFIYKWLLESIEDRIDPYQFGAIKNSCTTDALLLMIHNWFQALDGTGSLIRICLLDFSKAFDKIDHNVLISKLRNMNIHPVIVNWIIAFLSGRYQRIKLKECTSSWIVVNAGVPQGTKLGPLLFLIMINNFKPTNNIIKFVDDSSIYEIVQHNARSNLDRILSKADEWVERNNMELNGKKTKELRITFSNHNFDLGEQLLIANIPINVVRKAKLLGLTISDNLKWNDHIQDICSKASKRLYFLRILQRAGFDVPDLVKMYLCYIRPVLEYACPVWHSCIPEYLCEQVEAVQKRALRIICKNVSYSENMESTGIVSLKDRRESLCRKYLNRINKPSNRIFNLLPPGSEHQYNLRNNRLPSIKAKTERFRNSFIPYAIRTYP